MNGTNRSYKFAKGAIIRPTAQFANKGKALNGVGRVMVNRRNCGDYCMSFLDAQGNVQTARFDQAWVERNFVEVA